MASDAAFMDLHIHSTASDGTFTPAEILEEARRLGLFAISITDHDTTDGVRQALETGIPDDLVFVPGVEISADLPDHLPSGSTLHILGYFVDIDDPGLIRALSTLQQARDNRNPRIIERLQALGLAITSEEVAAKSGDGQTGRPHIASVLLEKGIVDSVEQAFERYLAKDRPGYVDKFRLGAAQAVEVIRAAGGVAVCAHPSSLLVSDRELDRIVAWLAQAGLGGIEAWYSSHTPEQTKKYRRLAEKHGLAVTGGTDFHGASKPEIAMGSGRGDLKIPRDLLGPLEALAGQSARPATRAAVVSN